MKQHRRSLLALATVVFLALLAAPIFLYTHQFGVFMSAEHAHWADFGAYVGGIYAPIAALITLLIISGQLSSQIAFNEHQIDQCRLANARADLHFYLDQLHNSIAKLEQLSNAPLSHMLVVMFSSKSHEQLQSGKHTADAKRIRATDDRISALWDAVYTIFQGLRAVQEIEYELVYLSSKQKCIAMFGYELCDALDNYHYVASGYPAEHRYEFHAGSRPEL